MALRARESGLVGLSPLRVLFLFVMRRPSHWSNPLEGARRDEEAAAALPRAIRGGRRFQMRQARLLARLDAVRHHRTAGAAGLEEYALRCGLGPRETHDLVRLGHLVRTLPAAEAAFLEGRLPLESASSLHLALSPVGELPPDASRPAEGWLELACQTAPRDFADLVRQVRAELQSGTTMVRISVLLSEKTLETFHRAKRVLRHMRKRAITEDELVQTLCREFLDRHDPARPPLRERKVVATGTHSRHVTARDKREVIERDGYRCIHPGCTCPGPFHLGHIRRYSEGGGNTADELVLQCWIHNELEAMGMVQILGPAYDPGFQYRLGGPTAQWSEVERPYAGDAEARRERADRARKRSAEEVAGSSAAGPAAGSLAGPGGDAMSPVQDASVDDVAPGPASGPGSRPDSSAAAGGRVGPTALPRAARPPTSERARGPISARFERCDGGTFVTEHRIRIPHLEARDPTRLAAWLQSWFALRAERARMRDEEPSRSQGSRTAPHVPDASGAGGGSGRDPDVPRRPP